MRFLAGLGFCLLIVTGCSNPQPVERATAPAMDQPAPPASFDKILAKDKQEYDLAKLGYAKDSASKTAKDTYVFTTVRYGLAKMDQQNSEHSKVKYPDALRLFREALKIDPTNKDALQNKDLIESIYKQ